MKNFMHKEVFADENGNEIKKLKEAFEDGKRIYFEEFLFEGDTKTITVKDYRGQRFQKTAELYANGKLVMSIFEAFLNDDLKEVIDKFTTDYHYFPNGDVKSISKCTYELNKLVAREQIQCYDTTSGRRQGPLTVIKRDRNDKITYLLEARYVYTADGHKIYKEKIITDFLKMEKVVKYKRYYTVDDEDVLFEEEYLTYDGLDIKPEKLKSKRVIKYKNGTVISDNYM